VGSSRECSNDARRSNPTPLAKRTNSYLKKHQSTKGANQTGSHIAAALGARPSVPGSRPPEENEGRSSQYRNLGKVRRIYQGEPCALPTISAPPCFQVSAPVFVKRDVCNLRPGISPYSQRSLGLKGCPILLCYIRASSSNLGSEARGSDNVRPVYVGQFREAVHCNSRHCVQSSAKNAPNCAPTMQMWRLLPLRRQHLH
jgi:hypothetical protein